MVVWFRFFSFVFEDKTISHQLNVLGTTSTVLAFLSPADALRSLCFVPYAKNTLHITTLTHDVHLAWTRHIKSRKAQMAERFCELCTSVEWTQHLFIFSFSVELWGDVEWKRNGISLAWQNLSSSHPLPRIQPHPLQQSSKAVHLQFVWSRFQSTAGWELL